MSSPQSRLQSRSPSPRCAIGRIRAGSDLGSATVWTVGAIAALLAVVVVVLTVAAAVVTKHRVTAAADLAALAAAGRAFAGEAAACEQAAWVAERMRTSLRFCHVRGLNARVEVSAHGDGLLSDFGACTARARAGPVSAHL